MTERKANINRVLIAGTGSGCGKTTVTCAVLSALKKRGLDAGAAKCGPDYIDPMFHRSVIGAPSVNLDPFFFDENTLRFLLAKNGGGRDLTVIEGVMGYYDGLGLTTAKAGAYDLARITKTPVVLTVNARGASLSILAIIKGFLDFVPESFIKGVIFNNCTEKVYSALAPETETRLGIKPLGFMPSMPECGIGSRHLGLVTADEIADIREKMRLLAEQAERSIDLEGVIALAASAPELEFEPIPFEKREPVRVAVARDRAFCFYYEDSLDLLCEMGAEIVPFSPIADARLPENVHGLYLGGGYPELWAERLSANITMRESVGNALTNGLPCIAECGGFMYLTEAIGEHPMVGFIKGRSFDNGRLTRFGYVRLTAEKDNMLCRRGGSIPAHEFHHWDAEDPGDGFAARKPDGRSWACVHAGDTLYAGYPHMHFYAEPDFARGFYDAMLKEKHRV
ncbi:MAG: cobyrinate a,c-diamide synthase [Clostridia bacterium]|nr:cobyrinate a,c-diamide synthase [Clostridia bacterium]